jgi:hypothetical protein
LESLDALFLGSAAVSHGITGFLGIAQAGTAS